MELKRYHGAESFTISEENRNNLPITDELRNIQSFLLKDCCCCDYCSRWYWYLLRRFNFYETDDQTRTLCDDDWCWSKNDESFMVQLDRKTRRLGNL